MKRIYIAGSYNAPSIIECLDNIRRGMRMAVKVLMRGYAPFTPWLDFHYRLMQREDEEVTREMYHAQSMAWLEVSDAVLVMPNSENSKGAQAEISRAKELGIPVCYSLDEVKAQLLIKDVIRLIADYVIKKTMDEFKLVKKRRK